MAHAVALVKIIGMGMIVFQICLQIALVICIASRLVLVQEVA